MQPNEGQDVTRNQQVDRTLQALVELVLIQKFADMPEWVALDLTVSQLKAIFRLAFYPELTISELAGVLEIGSPAASILVQQLVERGLAERLEDPQDRRRTLVRLTPRGMELVGGRRERREARARGWLNQMDAEDLAGLQRGLSRLLEIIKADPAIPAVPAAVDFAAHPARPRTPARESAG